MRASIGSARPQSKRWREALRQVFVDHVRPIRMEGLNTGDIRLGKDG
jgi:hypothetical protein